MLIPANEPTIEILARYDRTDEIVSRTGAEIGKRQIILVRPRTPDVLAEPLSAAGKRLPLSPTILLRLDQSNTPEVNLRIRVQRQNKRFVRLLRKVDGDWIDLGTEGEWSIVADAFEADQGIPLIVLAENFARPARHRVAGWDGNFQLTVTLLDDKSHVISRDKAAFAVAPFIIPGNLDPGNRIYLVDNPMTKTFQNELGQIANDIPIRIKGLGSAGTTRSDVWAQDTVLIGVAPIPDDEQVTQFAAALSGIRGKHDGIATEPLDHNSRFYFQSQNAIVVDCAEAREKTQWIDWYGNIGVTPPIQHKVSKYPYGRIITGYQNELGFHPDAMAFFAAQKLQWPPISLDVSWLTVGHIDETVSFVPAENQAGFKVVIPSVDSARQLLKELISEGYGGQKMLRGKADRQTIKHLHDETALSPETFRISTALKRQKQILAEELELSDQDFIELPALFRDGLAVIPNAVNCVVLGKTILIADPHGPSIHGVDPFKKQIVTAFKSDKISVKFVDIWEPYHVRSGAIHCATNVMRSLLRPAWWNQTSA